MRSWLTPRAQGCRARQNRLEALLQGKISGRKVMSMYQNGIDIDLISRNLGITSGEAELIISINNIK